MSRLATLGAATAALTLAGCSSASFQWRSVAIAGQSSCLPVATTLAAQQRGLQGVRPVARAMVFQYSPPAEPSFWMKDTPSPLTGVWVGASRRVIGYWHGRPESTTLHPPPAPIAAVVEYPYGTQVPGLGATVAIGARCQLPPGGRL